MRTTSLTLSIAGLACTILSILTAVAVLPPFLEVADFGDVLTTTIFWVGLSIILLLAGIAFGVISREEI
jgi:Mg2+/citrate symporter